MGPIQAQFEVVKVGESEYDVLVFAEEPVLKAFATTYDNIIYLEKSKFDGKPMAVLPGMDSNLRARTWVGYWQNTFADPENACQSCNIVQDFFRTIAEFRNVGGEGSPQR